MPTEVVMPALGMAQDTGRLLRWLKTSGAHVERGEPLMEVETDKVTVEVEAPAAGTLTDVRAAEGEDVPVGRVIALILAEGEAVPAAPEDVDARHEPSPRPEPGTRDGVLPHGGPGSATRDRMPSSPLARRRAAERGVDLSNVRGTGPEGAVTSDDVAAARTTGSGPAGPHDHVEEISASAVWRRMAERTAESWTAAPHFYLARDANAERLVGWRRSVGDGSDGSATVTDVLVKLVAEALRRHPEMNGMWDGARVLRLPDINIGVAVAVRDGLVVPVIHRADALPLHEIAKRRRDLVGRAREGRLRPEDLQGGTFTLSNLGMYDVDVFFGVINPPQAAILTVGRIADRVTAEDGLAVVRPMVTLGLSTDHRAADGVRAAQFLRTLVGLIEEPSAQEAR